MNKGKELKNQILKIKMLFHIKKWPVCLTNVFPPDKHHTSVYGRSAIWYTPFCTTMLKRHALKGQTFLSFYCTFLSETAIFVVVASTW